MTKLLGSVALTVIMASSLSAENFSDAESANQAHTESTTPPPQEILKSKESKSGFFLGVEGEVSSVSYDRSFSQTIGVGAKLDWGLSKIQSNFGGNLNGGYQHYFDEKENHGLRIKLSIGSGMPLDGTKNVTYDKKGTLLSATLNSDIYYLKTSLELSYLWDFLNKGKHTLGLDVGLGYDLNTWFEKISFSQRYKLDELTTILSHNIYPQIGLHYYYGNHQFNIAYKFGGILSGIKGDISRDVSDGTESYPMKESIQSSPSYFSFGYSYRF